jgi:large subunit ribosomal protein L32e
MITMDTRALEHRRRIKAKKPRFLRQDAHKRAKFRPASWRKPKGFHSKMRLGKKSYATKVQVGYGSPASVKGLHRSGLQPILVATPEQLGLLDPKTEGAVIISALGDRKRELLLRQAKEKRIMVLNLKVDEALKELSEAFAARKTEHAVKLTEKQKREAEKKRSIEQRASEKKAEERAEAKDEKSAQAEEKAKELEAEKQKVLTKRT